MADDKKKTNVPPSLQPRKKVKKSIPTTEKKVPTPTPPKKEVKKEYPIKEEKERFTLWVSKSVYNAFKIHTATRKGGASKYIEELIKKDLGIK